MNPRSALRTTSDAMQRLFWRGAASVVGLAASHRTRLRWVSALILAAAAFLSGQTVGRMLLGQG